MQNFILNSYNVRMTTLEENATHSSIGETLYIYFISKRQL